jgi:hypothetical protein
VCCGRPALKVSRGCAFLLVSVPDLPWFEMFGQRVPLHPSPKDSALPSHTPGSPLLSVWPAGDLMVVGDRREITTVISLIVFASVLVLKSPLFC